MRRANIKAATALTKFFTKIETQLPEGMTEWYAKEMIDNLYADEKGYKCQSFKTASSSCANAAIIHHKPSLEHDVQISPGVYLSDSGAQYTDGTTDTTRTIWIGPEPPSAYIKECYTRVLKGHISIESLRFPKGATGYQIDVLARQYLWEVGLDYKHGTGHGIGCYGMVHEGPYSMRITNAKVAVVDSMGNNDDRIAGITDMAYLRPGYIVSNEPGYYEVGAFGIRIENAIAVREAAPGQYYFESLMYLPYSTDLIVEELLTSSEKAWLNAYNKRCREILLPIFQADNCCREWILKHTGGYDI